MRRWRAGRRAVRGRFAGVALLVALGLVLGSPSSYADGHRGGARPDLHAHVVFTITSSQIQESSDLVVSTAHQGLAYTTNDSGDGPFVYVLNPNGALVGTTTLAGVSPVDVEALAADDGSLIVADVGDNSAVRGSVQIYRIPQPASGNHTVTPEKVTLTYADGPRNAESALFDPASGRMFVVSKEVVAHVYDTPPHVFSRSTATLTAVAAAPSIATDAAFLPGRSAVVIRTYPSAFVYSYPSWRQETSFALPKQHQGESVASLPGQAAVWVGSEGADSRVWWVPLPSAAVRLVKRTARVLVPPTAPPRGRHPLAPTRIAGQALRSTGGRYHAVAGPTVALSAGAAALVVGAVALLARRRRTPAGSGPR